jgi:allantoin racemase
LEVQAVKIKVVLPVPHSRWNANIEESARKAADKDTYIEVVNTEKGAETLEGFYYGSFAEVDTIKKIIAAEKQGFDAVVVWCTANAGVEAAREAVSIPVVGIMEAAHMLAMLIGRRFSELVSVEHVVVRHWRNARNFGTESKLASVRVIGLPIKELHADVEHTYKKMYEAGKKAIEEDKADVLVLGCGAMLGITDRLRKELEVPVLEPGEAGIKVAEMLVNLELSHSKKGYLPLIEGIDVTE